VGLNYTFGSNWLIGVEGDFSAADINGTHVGCAVTGCSSSTGAIDDLATVRGRLGFIWNNALFYGTGGWAWSHSHTDRTITCVGAACPGASAASALVGMTSSASGDEGGWAAGGGIEYMFAPRWTVRVEYLHYQFDGVVRDYSYAGFPTASRHNVSDNSIDTIRFGVNYLFNFGGIR
jgi:outer membrane immunogenic protein